MSSRPPARFAAIAAAIAVWFLLMSAGGAANAEQASITAVSVVQPVSSLKTAVPRCDPDMSNGGPEFKGARFPGRPKIDNAFLPFVPGTQLILEGSADTGKGLQPHRVVLTVTDVTKEIDGVQTLVLWDRDFSKGQLVEEELTFVAQDRDGNVWNLGEYPEEYEDGEFIGAPSTWLASVNGKAGIHMLARPRVGLPPYIQGFAPEIDFADCGQVLASDRTICVPSGCSAYALIIEEWDAFEPDARQHKYYAPGVGNIRVEAVDDPQQENLQLVTVFHLSGMAMEQARERALQLDKRAYRIAPDVFEDSPRAERLDADRDRSGEVRRQAGRAGLSRP